MILILAVSMFILIAVVTAVFFIYYEKKSNNNTSPRISEGNDIYLSVGSDEIISEGFDLPKWLNDKPEMVFPVDAIEKGHELGSGRYGTVIKGRLKQRISVYVHNVFT